MITRWPCMLLVAFYLFTSAATADAECAWVLWLELEAVAIGGEPKKWTPVASAQNLATCDQELTATIEWQRKPQPGESIEVRKNVIVKKSESVPLMTLRYVCLPDTVDPRGPKGK